MFCGKHQQNQKNKNTCIEIIHIAEFHEAFARMASTTDEMGTAVPSEKGIEIAAKRAASVLGVPDALYYKPNEP